MSERHRVLRHGKSRTWHHFVSICSLMVSGIVSANAATSPIVTEIRTYSHPQAGSDTFFGFGTGISSKYAIVLGGHKGPIYATEWNAAVFDATTGQHLWTFTEPVPSNNNNFRFSTIAIDGDIAVIGTEYADVAFVYDLANGVLKHTLVSDDLPTRGNPVNFGNGVDIAGNRIVVSSRGYAHVFDANTGDRVAKINPNPTSALSGVSVAISESAIVVGAADSSVASSNGAAFSFDAQTFAPLSKFVPTDAVANDYFGGNIAIDGNYAIARSESGAYVFDVITGQQLRKLNLPGNTDSIERLDIDGTTALLGNPALERVMTFDWTTGNVLQDLVPSDYANTLNFGYSVGLDGRNAIVGDFSKAYQFQVVPEPSSGVMILIGLIALTLRKDRPRHF